jgi:hypothetical protein
VWLPLCVGLIRFSPAAVDLSEILIVPGIISFPREIEENDQYAFVTSSHGMTPYGLEASDRVI